MSRRAWALVLGVIGTGGVLAGIAFLDSTAPLETWQALGVLATFATLSQLAKSVFTSRRKSETEGKINFSPSLLFLAAGIFLFSPWQFVLLVLIPHLLEWIKGRLQKSNSLRAWYIQPFNIAAHICCGLAARAIYYFLIAAVPDTFPVNPAAALVALVFYVALNHLLVGLVLVLARGASWKDTGVLNWDTLMPDLMLLCMGYSLALLWEQNPWFSLFALSPLLLIQRALAVPQLQKEARVDAKTGLWNAAHFSYRFAAELERATRFARPLSVIMADLDFLRNVNNIYGHLAGDTVLETIGLVIRQVVREYDIAGRFGGEEFAIALPETDQATAVVIAERIREVIARTPITVQTSLTPIFVTMSCGIASFPSDGGTTKELIHQADIAVYQAKLQGRNRVISAADVPHSIRLETLSSESTRAKNIPPASASAKQSWAAADKSTGDRNYARLIGKRKPIPYHPEWIAPFVGIVIFGAVLATLFGLMQEQAVDAWLLVILISFGALAEWFKVGMYDDSTVSVSVTIVFAAIFLLGFVGLVSVSAGIVIVHYLKNRETELFKLLFNWANLVLAGLFPIYGIHFFRIPLIWENLLPLAALTLATALAYYVVESGLTSIAVSLSEESSIRLTWRRQFGWTVLFYTLLCLIGLFMAVAVSDLKGIAGTFVFALPLVLMHYVQREYIRRTQASVSEVERMNKGLTQANRAILQASLEIEQLNDELFATLAKIIDARDPQVLDHAVKVANYSTRVAHEMELPSEHIERIRQAALLHDIGKIGIAERIVKKPARLSGLEYESIKTHTTLGSDFLEASRGLRHLASFVRHHHEWWDGKGYPDRLKGEQSPLEARIIAVADAVDSMASPRPYHQPMDLDEVVAELIRCAGTQFDPSLADLFVRVLKRDGLGILVDPATATKRTADRLPASVPVLPVPNLAMSRN